MKVFCEKRSHGFQVHVFSNVAELVSFTHRNQLEILLIAGSLMSEEIQHMNIGKIILLTDGEVYEAFSDYENIYKYQSAEKILKELLCCYAEYARPTTGMHFGKKEFEIHGVYSPIGRCGKSTLARILAEKIGQKKRTLLLDLQSYSACLEQLGDEEFWDLADMIYFLRQGKKPFLYKLGSIVQSRETYDYIYPMKKPTDIRSVTLTEWMELMDKFATESDYQVLVLDFGNDIQGMSEMLKRCDRIYTPVLSDEDSRRKIRNFEMILKDENSEKVLQYMEKINLPAGVLQMNWKPFLEEWAERNVML
jgi:hypothetical protein